MARPSSYQKLRTANAQLKLENESLKNKLSCAEAQLTHDTLTGVFSEQGFFEHLERLIADLTRHHRTLAIAYADINNFKSINDNFGHAEGDRAIIHIAQTLKSTLREIDIVARLHGDEFAIALPDITTADIHIVLRRINSAIANNPFHTTNQQVPLTIAIAAIPYDPTKSLKKNLIDADQKMLAQKTHRKTPRH